jgi:ligand-binding sensor domain-containing protein
LSWSPFSGSSLAGGINGIALDQQQRVWIATAKNGVVRFDGRQWLQYHAWDNTAMQSDVVFSISVDRRNRVWIGTDKGIVIYDNP